MRNHVLFRGLHKIHYVREVGGSRGGTWAMQRRDKLRGEGEQFATSTAFKTSRSQKEKSTPLFSPVFFFFLTILSTKIFSIFSKSSLFSTFLRHSSSLPNRKYSNFLETSFLCVNDAQKEIVRSDDPFIYIGAFHF